MRNQRDPELDNLIRNHRSLTPDQRTVMERKLMEQARTLRAQAIRGLFMRFTNWLRRRAAIARLRRLDDRMLKDIGLNRGEIESAVLGFPQDHVATTRVSVPSCGA